VLEDACMPGIQNTTVTTGGLHHIIDHVVLRSTLACMACSMQTG